MKIAIPEMLIQLREQLHHEPGELGRVEALCLPRLGTSDAQPDVLSAGDMASDAHRGASTPQPLDVSASGRPARAGLIRAIFLLRRPSGFATGGAKRGAEGLHEPGRILTRVRDAAVKGRAYRVHVEPDMRPEVGYVGGGDDLARRIAAEVLAVGGNATVAADIPAARQALADLLARYEPRRALCWQHPGSWKN